jgi:hypothetical protein
MEKFIRTVLRGLGCSNAPRLPDGNITTNDKPSPQELGWLASYAVENVKEGDRILVRGRLQGTPDGKPTLWVDKSQVVHASSISLTVHELSITEAKANRPAKAAPAAMPVVEEPTDSPASESQGPLTESVSESTKTSSAVDDVFTKYVSNSKQ